MTSFAPDLPFLLLSHALVDFLITSNFPPLPHSYCKSSPPFPLSCSLLPLPPPLHFPPRPSQRLPLLRFQSAFLSVAEVQRLRPGSIFPPLLNPPRVLVFTPRELGGGRTSVKSTSILDLALVRRARPEFGEGLSVVAGVASVRGAGGRSRRQICEM